jgi:hypothetical protein
MSNLWPIFRLTTLTVFLTVGLLAFTLVTKDKFEESEILACGTVDMSSDVAYPKYYIPLEHPGLKIFQNNCKACHRLDEKLVGPALRNSFETRDSVWFTKMISSANGLIDSGDTLAVRLFNDYNQTRHPDFKALDKNQLADLVEYLKLEGLRDSRD